MPFKVFKTIATKKSTPRNLLVYTKKIRHVKVSSTIILKTDFRILQVKIVQQRILLSFIFKEFGRHCWGVEASVKQFCTRKRRLGLKRVVLCVGRWNCMTSIVALHFSVCWQCFFWEFIMCLWACNSKTFYSRWYCNSPLTNFKFWNVDLKNLPDNVYMTKGSNCTCIRKLEMLVWWVSGDLKNVKYNPRSELFPEGNCKKCPWCKYTFTKNKANEFCELTVSLYEYTR